MNDRQKPNGKALVLHRGKYYVTYYENGKRKQLNTKTRKLIEAERIRDEFFVGMESYKRKATKKPRKFIYSVGGKWQVRVRNKYVGVFALIGEAAIARNEYCENEGIEV